MGIFTAVAGFALAYGIAIFIVGSAVELGYNLFPLLNGAQQR